MTWTVAHVSSVHPILDNRILFKECATLASEGYDVHLVGVGMENRSWSMENIAIHEIKGERSRIKRMAFTTGRVVRKAMALKPDIVHLHDPELMPYAAWLSRKGKKVIFDMHEDFPKALRTKEWIGKGLRRAAGKIGGVIEQCFLNNVAVVCAEDSYRVKRGWLSELAIVRNMPIAVRMRGINEPKVFPPSVGYMGSVTEMRGCLNVLKAIGQLQKQGIEVAYDCVGNVPVKFAQKCADTIKREGIRNVRYHGFLCAEEGYRIMAGCAIGVSLLYPIPNYQSSYPTKIFEYMALGLPCLVSSIPLHQSIVDECNAGISVDPLNIEAIAQGISLLLNDPARCLELGENGKQAIEQKYSWERESRRLLDFYKRLLNA